MTPDTSDIEQLWHDIDAIQYSMDTTEYKHLILGLVFLRHISEAFDYIQAGLDQTWVDADQRYTQNVFHIPPEGHWSNIVEQIGQPAMGQIIDDAISAIERENPSIKDILTKNYAKASLSSTRLGEIIKLIDNIWIEEPSKGVLPQVYEYFLCRFVNDEGRRGGEFYTPRSVTKLLVEMLRPHNGHIYDPCCGTAGMFVQSAGFIRNAGGQNISVYGQESDHATWQLAKMNMAVHQIDSEHILYGDTLGNDLHADLKVDYILASPPFASKLYNDTLQDDQRWPYGIPPKGNANFAWVQHMICHLTPSGRAGFVLSNDSMSSVQSGQGDIRKKMIEANLIDCVVALPGQLFYSAQIPACLWFVSKDKADDTILFIDARRMGRMIDQTHRELTGDDIGHITRTYRDWHDNQRDGIDTPGFCRGVNLKEIRNHKYILNPAHYVRAEPYEALSRLAIQWADQQAEAKKLDMEIKKQLKSLGVLEHET